MFTFPSCPWRTCRRYPKIINSPVARTTSWDVRDFISQTQKQDLRPKSNVRLLITRPVITLRHSCYAILFLLKIQQITGPKKRESFERQWSEYFCAMWETQFNAYLILYKSEQFQCHVLMKNSRFIIVQFSFKKTTEKFFIGKFPSSFSSWTTYGVCQSSWRTMRFLTSVI